MITVRPALPDDAALLLHITQQAFEPYRDQLDPPSGVFQETLESVQHKIETGDGFFALLDDHIAGSVLVEFQTDHIYVGRLAVLPDFQGKGIARALMAAVEDLAQQHQITRIEVAVRLVLTPNRAMFAHLGFREISYETHDGYSAPTFVVMAKEL